MATTHRASSLAIWFVLSLVSSWAQAEQAPLQLGGYAEVLYQWNGNRPANGVTAWRGFDNRHNSFTISNVALDARWDRDDLVGRVTLQVGHTPSSYYQSEPGLKAEGGANASSAELWKYVQQAYAGYRFGGKLTLTAGLQLSPIGPECIAVRDSWNWSRSNLFFGLPFYHTGAQASLAVSSRGTLTLAAWNGWNAVVDANDGKSVSAQFTWNRPDLALSALYFGGVERARGAPEGQPWRHLLDVHATWHATPGLSLLAHGNVGAERNAFGVSSWQAAAVYARVRLAEPLFLALRGDGFREQLARNDFGSAAPIFWPAPWVASATATLDYRPHPQVSIRLEYRHDQAGAPIYFGSDALPAVGGATSVPTRSGQDSLTLGVTSGF
jgi:hypothetical protein